MDIEQLDVLEEKINQAVKLIEHLMQENDQLKAEVKELRSESESRERTVLQLKEENQNLQLVQTDGILGREKEEKIRSKVEQMLAKLDELQYIKETSVEGLQS
ncbi:MAG: cell division protein ZapB [Calditrichaeota bacterium]|nr:cell division protein ZapB [Calditrichota bacterium]